MVENLSQFIVKTYSMGNYRKINDEVYYLDKSNKFVTQDDINFLKEKAKKNKSQKCRLCTHNSEEDFFQEMFIVHTKSCFVRPHYHKDKSESLHVIEGNADLFIFNSLGDILSRDKLGPIETNGVYYYRINENIIHTMKINSEFFIFKESTTGPFKRNMMIFPDWSPIEYTNDFNNLLKHFTK